MALALAAEPVLAQTPEGAAVQDAPAPVAAPVAPTDAPAPVTPAAEPAQPVDAAPPAPASTEAVPAEAAEELTASAEPPKGFTGLYGQVVDAQTKEALIEATVKVVGGGQQQVLTDVDGHFRLPLPPGRYDLRVFYDVYEGRRITNVIVSAGKPTKLDVALSADAGAVQEVVVEARADRRAEGALLQERKKAAAVSDAISAQEIARTPDSSASDAVKRVVSATVVDGRYMLLRGLGGRYAVTLLNGALLPSPEPDEPSVPLDIFPTSLLANLNVVKSYTSDLPGTFGGGALLIETNSYPTRFEIKPRVSVAYNTLSTFQQRNAQPGSGLEWLGFASGERNLPASVPTDGPLRNAQAGEVGQAFPNVWNARRQGALPNLGLGVSMGDTVHFGNQRLGYLASVNYSRRETLQQAQTKDLFALEQPGTFDTQNPARSELGSEAVNLSGLVNASYQFSRDNELTLFSLYTRGTESRAETTVGEYTDLTRGFEGTRLQFVTRALSFNQLRGFHRLSTLGEAELDWQANLSRVDRDEPDTRDITYYADEDGSKTFRNQPGSGDRFFAELGETSTGGSLNVTVPLSGVRLKVGGLTQLSFRDFNARRFRFSPRPGGPGDLVNQEPETLFAPDNVGPNVGVVENTFPEDAYDATLNIFAGYVMADAAPLERLRLIGGLRYEVSNQTLEAASPFTVISAKPDVVNKTYRDVLPTASAVYALSDTVNLRAGYSYTLARPTFRELAPFLFFDFVRRRAVSGNVELLETRIHNADVRAEWFTGENEVLAASAFAKRFINPIERTIGNAAGGDIQYTNAPGGDAYGLELEARTSLARLTPALSPFRLAANLTLIHSRVDLGAKKGSQTNSERPLQGQSPYVVNVNLGYERAESGTEIAVLYNVAGRRISEAGISPLPDVYEQPVHRVDLAVSQRLGGSLNLKLTAANLLDSPIVLNQGGQDIVRYRPGMTFTAQLGWTL
jgi:outer membrane receptor protein involved in Fe transport